MMTSAWLRDIAADLKIAILFSTRLPLAPALPIEGADVGGALWALPIAGALVGLIGALVYALVHRLGATPIVAAALALAATISVTGALHEDGLADTVDGLGGTSPDKALEIMRDSRIGTFGACALILSIVLRISVLASLAEPHLVTTAIVAAHAAGRSTIPLFMHLVPRARPDGLSAAAGEVSGENVAIALALGAIALVVGLGVTACALSMLLLSLIIGGFARLCRRHFGGQTGDVLGALEQAGEILVLLIAAART
jgi:adenosylcobinamide-GDP ribazoletransferase